MHRRFVARPDAHRVRRPRALHPDLFFPPTRASTSPATAAAATRTAITGSPAASTTSSTSRATAWALPRWRARSSPTPRFSEAAVVGYPHDIKGQGIYAYVTLMAGIEPTEELRKELVVHVAQGDRPDRLGPTRSQFAPGPAQDPLGQDHAPHPAQDRRGTSSAALGDTSTLADPGVVDDLIEHRQNNRAARRPVR